jgi:nucleoside-diphosphate-sugar epimerase
LVTGGTGFAGSHIVRRLAEKGCHVFALVRNKERLTKVLGKGFLQEKNITPLLTKNPTELTSTDFRKIIEQNNITTVIHVAALVGEHWKIPWKKYFEVNVSWTKNLALAFLDADVSHNKFVFTSTVGVYGTIPRCVPADEETPYNPDGKYHKSKMLAEKELLKLKSYSNLPLIIFRPTIMYGNEDRGFLHKIFRLAGKKMFPLCSSDPNIHLLDVEILAETCSKLINREKTKCYIFNLCDNEPVKIKKLLEFIKSSMDAGYLTIPSHVFLALNKVFAFNRRYSISLKLISKNWFYNVDRLYKTFGLRPTDTIQTLKKKYLAWYRGW